MRKILGLILILFLSFVSASFADDYIYSDNLTIPNTFSSGETISSEKMNQNFQVIQDAINELVTINQLLLTRTDSIVLFETDQGHSGDLDGRTGADNKCSASSYNLEQVGRVSICSNIRSVISVDGSDNFENLQTNYNIPSGKPVISKGRTWIATNWSNFINHEIINTLSTAMGLSTFWAGFDGTNQERNCNGWTSTAGIAYEGIGSSEVDMFGGRENAVANCSRDFKLLCVCY